MTHWVNNWFDLVLHSDLGGSAGSPETIAFILLLSFVVGHLIAWVYMWTHQVLSYSQTFVASIVVLPPIVAMMMSLMSGSIVVAFGLLAVFAVVRFRNVLKDTRDTSFVLWAIVEGMSGKLDDNVALSSYIIQWAQYKTRTTFEGCGHCE